MFDANVVDSGRPDAGDSGVDDAGATDAGADADAQPDAGAADAGTEVTCVAGSAVELFRTAYLVGGQVPYAAAANTDGLMVASTVWTEANYPNYERVRGFLSQTGAVSALANVSAGVTFPSTAISLAPWNNGFLALFDDSPALGMSRDLWLRFSDASGTFMGTNASNWTNTPGKGETQARIARTDSGYVASWIDEDLGPMTAALDGGGALVGSASQASGAVGNPGSLEPFVIGANAFVAYFDVDQRVHGAPVGTDGVTGASATLSALTSTGNFAVAGGASTGALVYELSLAAGRTAVQFRSIGATGTTSLAEVRLHSVDSQGQRPSIAPLAGGYLVLFRFVPASGAAKLRLAFVAPAGELLSTFDLIDGFPDQKRFQVLVSPDNEVYVVFQEAASLTVAGGATIAGGAVHAMRVVCE